MLTVKLRSFSAIYGAATSPASVNSSASPYLPATMPTVSTITPSFPPGPMSIMSPPPFTGKYSSRSLSLMSSPDAASGSNPIKSATKVSFRAMDGSFAVIACV
ncbi:MAG: hypothetical protein ABGY41_05990 [Candidatus Poribacteria bacterium]